MKDYSLYYYSKLGSLRKPSVSKLLLEQKGNIIYDFRKLRELSRRNCNCLYFSDINRYCIVMATQVEQSDISLGAVIIDDDDFLKKLELKESTEVPNLIFEDCYIRTEYPSLAREGRMSLEMINAFRIEANKQEKLKHLNIPPMTMEEFCAPIIFEYVRLPIYNKKT